jgi:hypothetical protein
MKYYLLFYSIIINFLVSQDSTLTKENNNDDSSVQGAFGAVTIDGKIWNQIALRPTLPFGPLTIALDVVIYVDQDGNIHSDEWDFSTGEKVKNTLIDKIYYIRYGNRFNGNYFKIGALDNVTMGYGALINSYSNTLLYPQVRKVGMEFKVEFPQNLNVYGFTNDFKENMGLTGFRVSAPIAGGFTLGLSFANDRNQYLGLKDVDDDGRPDLVDDFPENSNFWIDSDDDGYDDTNPLEFDIDGDGITDTLDGNIPGWNIDLDNDGFPDIVVLDDDITRKPQPIDINNAKGKHISSYAIDLGVPLIREALFSLDFYSQYAALLGKTVDPTIVSNNEDTTNTVNTGYGLIPIGLSARFGPASFNLEFRMIPNGNFDFGYFNKSYELERSAFKSSSNNQGEIVTKSERLGTYGKQNGFYSSLNINLGGLFDAGFSYQNLNGEQYDVLTNQFQEAENQSFSGILKLTKSINKIKKADLFYQQRNVPNPFDFEFSESTIMGYNIGLELGNGMVLSYVFRRSFIDMNGDGDVKDENEMINMTSIETSFSF